MRYCHNNSISRALAAVETDYAKLIHSSVRLYCIIIRRSTTSTLRRGI